MEKTAEEVIQQFEHALSQKDADKTLQIVLDLQVTDGKGFSFKQLFTMLEKLNENKEDGFYYAQRMILFTLAVRRSTIGPHLQSLRDLDVAPASMADFAGRRLLDRAIEIATEVTKKRGKTPPTRLRPK
jgi:hypothetical protein